MNKQADCGLSFHGKLTSLADGYRVSRIFLTAIELGIFETLGKDALDAAMVAERTETNCRAMGILLDALAGMGLMEKEGNGYKNAPAIMGLLRNGSSDPPLSCFRHQNNCWKNWSQLTQVVRSGHPVKKPQSRAESTALASAMRAGSKEVADRLDLMMEFSGLNHICDVGCGPGAVCLELLQRHSHLSATLIDYDEHALEIARSDAFSMGVMDRVEIVRKNILDLSFEKKFDMVLMSMVLCLFGREEASGMLHKVRAALQPKGALVLGEVLLNNSRTGPLKAALFAAHLLVMGSRGGLYTLDGICELLRDSGFHYERFFRANPYDVVIGRNEPD